MNVLAAAKGLLPNLLAAQLGSPFIQYSAFTGVAVVAVPYAGLQAATMLPTALLLVLLVARPAQADKSWFFRPRSAAHSVRAAGEEGSAPPGASYATAWTSVATIEWARISPGDTLFVCGLHDGGRADGALNITKTQGSGVAGAPVTIDGRCVDDAGRADPGTLMAGKLVTPRELGSPHQYGIFTYSYDSPASALRRLGQHPLGAQAGVGTGMPNMPDILERSGGLVRLKHGDCGTPGRHGFPVSSAGRPVHPEQWAAGTACYTGIWTNRTTIYYKPSAGVTSAALVVYEYTRPTSHKATTNGWPPLALHYAEHVIVRNLTLQGPCWEIVQAAGGHHIQLIGNMMRWASFAAVSVGDVPGHGNQWNYSLGSTGTDYLTIRDNLITQTATGIYTVSMHTWQNSNHLYVGHNRFIDIDTENNYGNPDAHAIALQGGSFNLIEHNVIDGAGGSGITFYQGPDNSDGQPPHEMHDNVVRYNLVTNIYTSHTNMSKPGAQNCRGIEICDSRYQSNGTSYNNSVYYNVIANVTGDGLRSKAHSPGVTGHGKYQWRWLNNVVMDCGVGFSTIHECIGPNSTDCRKNEQVANNVFFRSKAAHVDGWDPDLDRPRGSRYTHHADDWQHNLFFPDGPAMFCFGLCANGRLPCHNCTTFAEFHRRDHPHPTYDIVHPPCFHNATKLPLGLRPEVGSLLLQGGVDVGLSFDWAGTALAAGTPPSIGVFQAIQDVVDAQVMQGAVQQGQGQGQGGSMGNRRRSTRGDRSPPLKTDDRDGSQSKTPTSWFFRPSAITDDYHRTITIDGGSALPAAADDGKSYDTAWTHKISWLAIKPGDTLFVCGFGSGPFYLPAGFSGKPGAGGEVTIDGNCPSGRLATDPDGSVDQALWLGGELVNSFPSPRWSGPDAAGIYTTTYGGSAEYGFAVAPNASEMSQLTRLARGACDASGPVNASAWPTQAFCAVQTSPAQADDTGEKFFFKPASSTEPVEIFGSLLGVLVTSNNSDIIIANLRMAFGARLLDINGGARVTLINNTLQYASSYGISFNAKAGHKGPHPGTQGALVTQNRISHCACGLYIINQDDSCEDDQFPNSQNSNDLVVSYNTFTSIDQENFYGNRDTHAIGIQGGSRCVYEHNLIDGVGGSGITFYQGPGQYMEDNVVRYNTITNVRDFEGKKNQRGIEFCNDNRAGNHTIGNNSIYYNVLANITHTGLRTKGLRSDPARGGPGPLAECTWRFLNNVVLDVGTAFELKEMSGNPDAQGSCVMNNIFACGLGAQPCSPGYRHQAGVPKDSTVLSNNLYWPDNTSYFCAAGGCTGFAVWARANSQNAGLHSMVAEPQFVDAQSWPLGLRPKPASAAVAAGRPVGLASDFAGATLPHGKAPDIGAFQVALVSDAAVLVQPL